MDVAGLPVMEHRFLSEAAARILRQQINHRINAGGWWWGGGGARKTKKKTNKQQQQQQQQQSPQALQPKTSSCKEHSLSPALTAEDTSLRFSLPLLVSLDRKSILEFVEMDKKFPVKRAIRIVLSNFETVSEIVDNGQRYCKVKKIDMPIPPPSPSVQLLCKLRKAST